MTDTFLNFQQNIFLKKCSEKKPSVGYSLLRNFPWEIWDVSQKFSEKKTSFGYCFSETNLVICVLPLLSTKWRRPLGGSSWELLELTSVSRFLAYVRGISSCWCNQMAHIGSNRPNWWHCLWNWWGVVFYLPLCINNGTPASPCQGVK